MKNLFAFIGFTTVLVCSYSIGEKRGYRKAVKECETELKKVTKKFVDERLMKESCESKPSGE